MSPPIRAIIVTTIIALIQVQLVLASPSSSIAEKYSSEDPSTIHSYEDSIDDDSGIYIPDFVTVTDKTPKGKKTTIVTSDTRHKTTRQIFDDDDDDVRVDDGTDVRGGGDDDGDTKDDTKDTDTTSFERDQDSDVETERPTSRKKPSERESSKASKEVFTGFPDDFMEGMKPFDFEGAAGSHRNSKSNGFVPFNMDDHHFPSMVATLGGLKPFPPISESDSKRSSKLKRPAVTPESFVKPSDNDEEQHEGFTTSNEGDEDADDFDKGFVVLDNDRSNRRKSAKRERHNKDDDDDDGSNQKRSIVTDASSASQAEFHSERLEPIAASTTKLAARPRSRFSSSSRTIDKDDSATSASSNVVREVKLKPRKEKKQLNDFSDSAQVQLGESQHLMPHFMNGPPMHFRFRPLETASHQGPPPIRQFRQASHHRPPPPFFPGLNHFHGGSDEGFFPGAGGGGEFGPGGGGGPALVPTSHFETVPQRFSQPEFRFPGERQRKLPPPHRPSATSQSHDNHHHDHDNHHGASATNNILGSGNFGIIRGGLFADDDNPEPSITPLHGYLSSNDDFFHGFRDFQPFGGGPMHNALSSKSHNIHRSQSKTAPVVVLPNSSKSTPSNSTSTTTTAASSARSNNKTATPSEMEEQIMEEK